MEPVDWSDSFLAPADSLQMPDSTEWVNLVVGLTDSPHDYVPSHTNSEGYAPLSYMSFPSDSASEFGNTLYRLNADHSYYPAQDRAPGLECDVELAADLGRLPR